MTVVEHQSVIAAVLGKPVQVPLGAATATGYERQLESTAAAHVIEGVADQGGPSVPGTAAQQVLMVLPAQVGLIFRRLQLVRPWEPDRPIRSITCVLDVREP